MSKMLIVSDIHGNWPALEAIIDVESDFDIAVFGGDVVDYGPDPVPCLYWVRDYCGHSVRGNHDNALAFDVPCRCMGTFREYSLNTRAWHHSLLSNDDIAFLKTMPTIDWFEWDGQRFRMAHAAPQGDLFEYLQADEWESRIGGLDDDFVLLGHTHVQDCRTYQQVTVVNPGSVGLARDTPGLACYAVYEAGEITLKRIPYDVQSTIARLRAAPLPNSTIEGLIEKLLSRPDFEMTHQTRP